MHRFGTNPETLQWHLFFALCCVCTLNKIPIPSNHSVIGPLLTFTGHTVLAGAEKNQQSQLRADEAFTGPRRRGKNQVGHGVGRCVDPSQTGTAQALSTCDGLQPLQPDRQHTAISTKPNTFFKLKKLPHMDSYSLATDLTCKSSQLQKDQSN